MKFILKDCGEWLTFYLPIQADQRYLSRWLPDNRALGRRRASLEGQPVSTGSVRANRRPIGRVTGANWEGIGVQPDVETPADAALWRAWEVVRNALNEGGAL